MILVEPYNTAVSRTELYANNGTLTQLIHTNPEQSIDLFHNQEKLQQLDKLHLVQPHVSQDWI